MIVFQQSPTIKEGDRTIVDTVDHQSEELLNKILVELKKMNFHMSLVSDTDIKDTEIE